MGKSRFIGFSLLWLVAACASQRQAPRQLPQRAAKQQTGAASREAARTAPQSLRLGDEVHPRSYHVSLDLDPRREAIHGEVTIALQVERPTAVVWLHGDDLTVRRAHIVVGGRKQTVKVLTGPHERLGFAAPSALPPGPISLTIEYEGKASAKDKSGIFRQQEVDDWYAFTQFEPLSARRAFPCFDEPRFKVPFELTLTVPKTMGAFTNAPAIAEEPVPGRPQLKRVRFAKTPPLPSYLVALAVGPFEVVDVGRIGRRRIPARIITPRGRATDAAWAVKATPPILERLEAYFGTPYPYAKLDQIAVPSFSGAMENPGLVTYGQSLILSHRGRDTIQRQRSFAAVCAHELAHIWFGDLVTMRWWDDLWLNESFATWMGGKIVDQWQPSWEVPVQRVQSRGRAMRSDSLANARRIHQPIVSPHDVYNAFDGITYGKGAAVLRMFESWIGADRFRDGVRRYLRQHAWGNATAADFLRALGDAGGKRLPQAFATFLDQPGVPLISMTLRCEDKRAPVLQLAQQRYLPYGSSGSVEATWQVPVCVAYGAGKKRGRHCHLLRERRAEVTLPVERCPEWLLGNDQATGYYRSATAQSHLARLVHAQAQLPVHERVGLFDNIRALVEAGKVPIGSALAWVPTFLETANRHIVSATADLVTQIDAHLVPEKLRPNYARYVRQLYGRRARQLAWTPKRGESEDTRLLRKKLLSLAAGKGEDPLLARRAARLTRRWLVDRKAIDAELTPIALSVAAKNGSGKLHRALYAQAKSTKDRKDRRYLLSAMGAFDEPETVGKNFEILLSKDFAMHEALIFIWRALGQHASRARAYDFVKKNFDTIKARLPRLRGAWMLYMVGMLCDEKRHDDAQSFFGPRARQMPGGPRALRKSLERVRLCVAGKRIHQQSVADFLAKY